MYQQRINVNYGGYKRDIKYVTLENTAVKCVLCVHCYCANKSRFCPSRRRVNTITHC